VVGLVGAHHSDDVLERGVMEEAPVVDGNGRSGHVLDLAGLDVLEVLGVGVVRVRARPIRAGRLYMK
jgi:hypothetical protein